MGGPGASPQARIGRAFGALRGVGFALLAVPGLVAGARVFGVPDVVLAAGDLVDVAAGDDGVGLCVGDGGSRRGALEVVVFLDEQPVWLAGRAAGLAVHA